MKRLFLGLLAGTLVSCGSLGPAPTTGQLLDAPTVLNLTGSAVKADATPTVSGETFKVRLTFQSGTRKSLPPFVVTDLYVVTRDGVWSTTVGAARPQSCGSQCGLTTISGPSRGMQRGAGAQVIVGLRDGQGRPYLLRDDLVRIR